MQQKLTNATATTTTSVELTNLNEVTDALQEDVLQVRDALRTLSNNDYDTTLTALESEIAALKREVTTSQSNQEVGTHTLHNLGTKLQKIELQVKQCQTATRQQHYGSLMVGWLTLRDRVSRGLSIHTDLPLLETLSLHHDPLKTALATIRTTTHDTTSNLTIIQREFAVLRPLLIEASTPKPEGFKNKLLHSLRKLVRIKKQNAEVTAEESILNHIDELLHQSKLNEAIIAFNTLPETVKSYGETWLEQVHSLAILETAFDDAFSYLAKIQANPQPVIIHSTTTLPHMSDHPTDASTEFSPIDNTSPDTKPSEEESSQ